MGTESIVLGKWITLGAVRIEGFCGLNGVPAGDVLGFWGKRLGWYRRYTCTMIRDHGTSFRVEQE